MASRYYCVQYACNQKNWVDLPHLASLKQAEAIDRGVSFSERYSRITRVIRKPHGWTPSDASALISSLESLASDLYETPLTGDEFEEKFEEPLVNSRKHEKARRRATTAQERQPTAWDHLDSPDFDMV